MANSKYAFFTENVNSDKLWSDNGDTTYQNVVVSSLPSSSSAYFIMADENGIDDLCKEISSSIITGYYIDFIRLDSSIYRTTPNIFVGDHPPHRP